MSEGKGLPRGKIKAVDPSVLPSLPTSWCWVSLNDLASPEAHAITDGPFGSNLKTEHYTDTGPRVIRLQNIGDGVFNDEYAHITEKHYEQLTRHSVQAEDIVVAGLGETLPRACVIPDWVGPAIVKADCPRVRLDRSLALPDFVCLALNSSGVQRRTSTVIHGVGRPRLNLAEIRGIWLPLAPLREQHRIVGKIEELFSDLDAGVSALQRAKANLRRYRASVLKSAVEGRLTEEWRKEHPQARATLCTPRLPSDVAPKKRAGRLWGAGEVPTLTEDERSRLPAGWLWAKVRDLGPLPDEVVQVGPMSMRSQDFEAEGVPVLNVGCVQWGGFNEDKLDYMPTAKVSTFDRYRIRTGDILFTRSGTVGRSAVAMSHQDGWLMTFHLLRVRCDHSVCTPAYLQMVFQGASHVRRQTREASIGSTRAGFNTRLLADLDIPLPPLAEQEQIVALVEERLSQIDSAEKTIDAELIRSKRLRQSILKQAFEGKLVPQDPKDEHASVLLERIKATREQEQPKKKAKKAGARTNSPRGQPR
jgi:type I restriction enzyme S subunit